MWTGSIPVKAAMRTATNSELEEFKEENVRIKNASDAPRQGTS